MLEVGLMRDQLVSFELVPTRVDDRGAPRIVIAESSYLPSTAEKKSSTAEKKSSTAVKK